MTSLNFSREGFCDPLLEMEPSLAEQLDPNAFTSNPLYKMMADMNKRNTANTLKQIFGWFHIQVFFNIHF